MRASPDPVSRARVAARFVLKTALAAIAALPHVAVACAIVASDDRAGGPSPCQGGAGADSAVPVHDCYLPAWFAPYRPANALDMVKQIPGFRLDNGDGSRGFGAAAGNVLINLRRPAAKQDRPEDILRRTPAARVARIELIRAGTGGIDMAGHAQLANVVLRDDGGPAASWDLLFRRNLDHGDVVPEGRLAVSSAWRGVEYAVGLAARRFAHGDIGIERVRDAGTVRESRHDRADTAGTELKGNFGATWWRGATQLALATDLRCESRAGQRDSVRTYAGGGVRDVRFGDEQELCRGEVGLTADRQLREALLLEAMAIVNHTDKSRLSTESAFSRELPEYRVSDANENESSEAIARLGLTWSGLPDHVVLSTFELSANRMRNRLARMLDVNGGTETAPVPGANGTVEELRANVFVGDAWARDGMALDVGLGIEASRLSQYGDAESERRFLHLAPSAGLTLAPDERTRWRMRLAREVSQLDFEDFVSETNLEDGIVAPGNPDLRPEVHWLAEVSFNRELRGSGALEITGFHHWIADVEDELPVTATTSTTGNLGDGRRWGFDVRATLPLAALGLGDSRLDLTGRWQDSKVADPVTGRERVLSDEREYEATIEYRYDMREANAAWGGRVRMLAAEPFFKVNELDVYDEGNDVQLFFETAPWGNMKLRLTVDDVFDRSQTRERRVYAGERHIAPLSFHESRLRKGGRRVTVALSGAF